MLRMETNIDLRPGQTSISEDDLEDLFSLNISTDFYPSSNFDVLVEELDRYNGPSNSTRGSEFTSTSNAQSDSFSTEVMGLETEAISNAVSISHTSKDTRQDVSESLYPTKEKLGEKRISSFDQIPYSAKDVEYLPESDFNTGPSSYKTEARGQETETNRNIDSSSYLTDMGQDAEINRNSGLVKTRTDERLETNLNSVPISYSTEDLSLETNLNGVHYLREDTAPERNPTSNTYTADMQQERETNWNTGPNSYLAPDMESEIVSSSGSNSYLTENMEIEKTFNSNFNAPHHSVNMDSISHFNTDDNIQTYTSQDIEPNLRRAYSPVGLRQSNSNPHPSYSSVGYRPSSTLNVTPSTSFSSIDLGIATSLGSPLKTAYSQQEASNTNSNYPNIGHGSNSFDKHWASHLAGILDEDVQVFPNSLRALNLLRRSDFPSVSPFNRQKEVFGTIHSEITSVYQYRGKVSDNETVYLQRAHNMFDRTAIRVDNKSKEQVGVIKREHSAALTHIMDNNLATVEGKVVNYTADCVFRIPLEITLSGDPSRKDEVLWYFKSNNIPVIACYKSFSPIEVQDSESPIPFDYDYDHVKSSRTYVTPAEMDNELDQMFKTLDEGDKVTEAEASLAVKTQLYPHQKQALNWMICKENKDSLPPFWVQRGHLYMNTLSRKKTAEKPKSIYGGILADDMGLGKTLEMISLIVTNFVNGKPIAEPMSGYTRDSFVKTSKTGPLRIFKSEIENKESPESNGAMNYSPLSPRLKLPNRISPPSLASVSAEWHKSFNNMKSEVVKSEIASSTTELKNSSSFPSLSPSRAMKRSNCEELNDDSSNSIFGFAKGKGLGKKSKFLELENTDSNQSVDLSLDFVDLTLPETDLPSMQVDNHFDCDTTKGFTLATHFPPMMKHRIIELAYAAANKSGSRFDLNGAGTFSNNIDSAIDVDALPDINKYEDITPVDSPEVFEVLNDSPDAYSMSSMHRKNSDSDTRSSILESKLSSKMNLPDKYAIVISDSEDELPDIKPLDLTKKSTFKKTISGSSHQRTKPDVANETVTSDVTNETVTWKRREVISTHDPATGRTLTNGPRGTLIICPLSVISNWVEQFDEHVDRSVQINLHVYYGPKRTNDITFLLEQDVVITTYATLSSDFKRGYLSPLHRIEWLRVVLDEGHTIRNPAAQQSKAIFELQADRRWVLTGTPIQNSLKDLWSLINFLQVAPFTEKKTWNQIIAGPLVKRERQALKRVSHLVRNLAMRRTKHQQLNGKPLVSLPAREVYLETVTLNAEERKIYDAMQINGQDLIGSYYRKGILLNNYGTVLTILLRLRQLCCHPQLVAIGALKKNPGAIFEDIIGTDQRPTQENKEKLIQQLKSVIESGSDEECSICLESLKEPVITACAHIYCKLCIEAVIEKNEQETSCPMCRAPLDKNELYGVEDSATDCPEKDQFHFNPEEWHSSSKVDALMKALNQLRQEDPSIKSVVVSQFTSLLTLLETPLKEQGFVFARLDGTMRAADRAKAVHDFANPVPGGPTIFLLSLKAGGVGINLTAASRVFLLDPAWNPAAEDQCFDRCHRLGQTRDVVITKFVIEDSVEERMLELQEKKKQLIRGVLDKKLSADQRRQKRIEEIKTLFNI
ncbi:helicase-like transcription factor [Biomphalaria pfeifferi]|uniref:Helicase-like transcription factor n=1 Tax=Biomphalaria pfeifferi TaxID=112525 RepID=A0AAD8CC43_BIOPF|nr:helicase-like transcription factor [Biomphalaria pfeifferi]